jgi:glycosyltransferase involved in cell wall biosynthesis
MMRANVWLFHNVFPVASASLYREARRRRIPVMYYCHNFRPFSVSGYLWNGERVASEGARLNFWSEIRGGVWQNSRAKSLYLASVFWMMHYLGWWKAITMYVAISEFMREFLLDAGVPDRRIRVIRHFWQPRPCEPGSGGKYYLFLGRLITAKGIPTLLEAWKMLHTKLGERTPKLLICGQGPMEQELENLRQPFVEYGGFKTGTEKDDLIANCRAMIAPSVWWEPLGLVTYEAYEFSRPMLAARSGGLTETIVEGRTGLLHTPGDSRELASNVMELESDPGRADAMGRAGRLWLESHTRRDDWIVAFRQCVDATLSESSTQRRPLAPAPLLQ